MLPAELPSPLLPLHNVVPEAGQSHLATPPLIENKDDELPHFDIQMLEDVIPNDAQLWALPGFLGPEHNKRHGDRVVRLLHDRILRAHERGTGVWGTALKMGWGTGYGPQNPVGYGVRCSTRRAG